MLEKLSEIEWSQPKIIETKNGEKKEVQSAELPDWFWEVWKVYKEKIKTQGISPSKYNSHWVLNKWNNAYNEEEKTEEIKTEIKNIDFQSNILYDYQIPHAKQIIHSLQKNNAGLDASDTGTGKTYVALAIAKELNLFPIVITPKSVIPSWEKVAKLFDLDCYVNNYEQYRGGKTKYYIPYENDKKDILHKWVVPENTLLIFDECNRCKNHSTQNAKMLRNAKRNKSLKTLSLSATIADNPLHLFSLGYALGIFESTKDFWRWAYSRGVYKGDWGLEFAPTKENLVKIHKDIFPDKGSRIAIKNLGDKFPDNLIISNCYDMNSASKKIQNIYKTMKTELKKLRESEQKDKGACVLTEILRARQKIELLKVPTLVAMAEDHIEEGNSVAVFVNFEETVQALSKKLKSNCLITGSITGENREKNIEDFQSDKERLIICNIRAGGIGISLHDLNGNHSRVSLISPSYSAQDLVQALGRIHRAGSRSKTVQKIVFCAGTIEEQIADKVNSKMNNIKLINDGDLF